MFATSASSIGTDTGTNTRSIATQHTSDSDFSVSKKRLFSLSGKTVNEFIIRTSKVQQDNIDDKFVWLIYGTNSPFHLVQSKHFTGMVQLL